MFCHNKTRSRKCFKKVKKVRFDVFDARKIKNLCGWCALSLTKYNSKQESIKKAESFHFYILHVYFFSF